MYDKTAWQPVRFKASIKAVISKSLWAMVRVSRTIMVCETQTMAGINHGQKASAIDFSQWISDLANTAISYYLFS
jgi:hypothetical protein